MTEDRIRAYQEKMFAGIEAGDRINIGGNDPVEVAKKNRKTVVTVNGVRYTAYEIYGVEPLGSEVAARHTTTVDWTPNNHGFPYRATCTCGWASRGYVHMHAAESMAEDHTSTVEEGA